MKETENLKSDKIEIVKEVEVKKGIQLIGSFKPKKGHTLFEVNMVTGEVKKAEYEVDTAIHFNKAKAIKQAGTRSKVIVKENCTYHAALNVQNLFRKLGFVIKK